MSTEGVPGATYNSPEEERRYRAVVFEGFEDFSRIDDVRLPFALDIPQDVDTQSAIQAYKTAGGQVRTYGKTVDQDTVSLKQWLITNYDARPLQTPDQLLNRE